MKNCSVKIFKGEVDNPNLDIFETLSININAVAQASYVKNASQVTLKANAPIHVSLRGTSGHFGTAFETIDTENLRELDIPANTSTSIYFANESCILDVKNKYNLKLLKLGNAYNAPNMASLDIAKLKGLVQLVDLYAYSSLYGNIEILGTLPALTFAFCTYCPDLTGDVSNLRIPQFDCKQTSVYGDYTNLLEVATNSGYAQDMFDVVLPEGKQISADYSKTSNSVTQLVAGASATKDTVARWTTTRSSDKYILPMVPNNQHFLLNFGSYLKAMLVNQAACTANASGSKNIYVKGVYDATDVDVQAALTTLYSKGYSVYINGTKVTP